jgi:hypothetical protein
MSSSTTGTVDEGSGRTALVPRLIRCEGMTSRMCWKAHLLKGGSCQLSTVTRDSFAGGKSRMSGSGTMPGV